MGPSQELQAQLTERLSRCEHFRLNTPDLSPTRRSREGSLQSHVSSQGEELLPDQSSSSRAQSQKSYQPGIAGLSWTLLAGAALGAILALAAAFVLGSLRSGPASLSADEDSSRDSGEVFERLYGRKLDGIAASVAALQGLHEVVARADETYDEVYHNQLVQSSRAPESPDEQDWNSFVREARHTGPAFLAGKEKLRDAVVNLHRLIRRTPDFMKHMVSGISRKDAEEASWFLRKVVTLAESVHSSMEAAAEKFAEVDMSMDAMTRDARENEEHLEGKALRLTDEAEALEGSPPVRTGSWTRQAETGLWGCALEKSTASLEACKEACLSHASGSCDRLTYYKTAVRRRCYLHCSSASPGEYREADTFILARAPQELAVDAAQKRRAGEAAGHLQLRWRSVGAPLKEVTRLVRRFRSATAELRKGLEEVRFAADDLRAAFESSDLSGGELDLRHLERRVGDVLTAVEDLGHTLAPMAYSPGKP